MLCATLLIERRSLLPSPRVSEGSVTALSSRIIAEVTLCQFLSIGPRRLSVSTPCLLEHSFFGSHESPCRMFKIPLTLPCHRGLVWKLVLTDPAKPPFLPSLLSLLRVKLLWTLQTHLRAEYHQVNSFMSHGTKEPLS